MQEMSLAPEVATVTATITVPPLHTPVGVRASLAGTGDDPTVSDWGFCDKEGAVSVETHRLGPTFFVARGIHYEIAYAPVNVEEWGKSFEVSEFTTATSTPIGTLMCPKRKGVVKLAFFSQDAPYTRVSSVRVTGTHNRFHMTDNVFVMRDDGYMGDDKAADGVFVTTFTAPAGNFGYAFIVNDADTWSRDPHEESTGVHVDADGFLRSHSQIHVR